MERTTILWGPWWSSSSTPTFAPDRNKVLVFLNIILRKLPTILAVTCLSTNKYTPSKFLPLAILAHLSTVAHGCRTTYSLIQTLTLHHLLTSSIVPTISWVSLILLGLTPHMPRAYGISLITRQITLAILSPTCNDLFTTTTIIGAIGVPTLIGNAAKAVASLSTHRRRLLLFIITLATLLTPVTAISTVQDTTLLTKAVCLLSTLWLSNRGKTDPKHDEGQLGPLDDSSILGSPTLRAGLHVPHVNIRGGISTFAKGVLLFKYSVPRTQTFWLSQRQVKTTPHRP